MLEQKPKHIALIMDGNRRWAKKNKVLSIKGHQEGAQNLRKIILCTLNLNYVKYLTCFAFSSENTQRSLDEINYLKSILIDYLKTEQDFFIKNNIRLKVIGNYHQFGEKITKDIKSLEERTCNNTKLTLVMALNYGSRNEIIEAVNKVIKEGKKEVTVEEFSTYLSTKGIPDPDLMIRTGKERRLSNFLLWQLYYTELFFSDTLWPDFKEEEFMEILNGYSLRKIRKGK